MKATDLLANIEKKVADFSGRCKMFLAQKTVNEDDIQNLRSASNKITTEIEKLLDIDDDIMFPADRLELISKTQEIIRKDFVSAAQKYVTQRISDLKMEAAAFIGKVDYFNDMEGLVVLFAKIEAAIETLSKEPIFTDPKNNIPLVALYEFKRDFSQQVVNDILTNLEATAGKYVLTKHYYKNIDGLMDNLQAIDKVIAQIDSLQKFKKYSIPIPSVHQLRNDFISQAREDLIKFSNEYNGILKTLKTNADCEQATRLIADRFKFISDSKLKTFFNTPESETELNKIKQSLTQQLTEISKVQTKFLEKAKFKPLIDFLSKYSATEKSFPIQEAYHKTKSKLIPSAYAKHQALKVDNHLKFLQTIITEVNKLPRENLKNVQTQAILIKGALEYLKNHPDLKSTIKTTGHNRFHAMLNKMETDNQELFTVIPNLSNISAPLHKFITDKSQVFNQFSLAKKIINPAPPKPLVQSFKKQNAKTKAKVEPTAKKEPNLAPVGKEVVQPRSDEQDIKPKK